jgi:hypothetical protein
MALQPHGRYLRAAIHEAGHCAVAFAAHQRIESVELLRAGGCTTLADPPTDGGNPAAMPLTELAFCIGGTLAGEILLGLPHEPLRGEDLRRYDGGIARARAAGLSDAQVERLIAEANIAANNIIGIFEPAIRAIAEELVRRRRLEGEEVEAEFSNVPLPAVVERQQRRTFWRRAEAALDKFLEARTLPEPSSCGRS